MDTRHTTTCLVITDPKLLLAELDALASSPTRNHTFVEAEKVRTLIYKHTKIVASSQVVAEEMASRVEPGILEREIADLHRTQIAHEITKELKLTTEVTYIDWRRDDPWHVTEVQVQ